MRYSDAIKIGDKVAFRARWDEPGIVRHGMITRLRKDIVWIEAFCFHADDLVSIRVTERAGR